MVDRRVYKRSRDWLGDHYQGVGTGWDMVPHVFWRHIFHIWDICKYLIMRRILANGPYDCT